MSNPIQKILSPTKKQDDTIPNNEKQALLGGTGRRKKETTPSSISSPEHRLTSHDVVRVWDVKMPPVKADMVNGTLLPTVGRVLVPALRQQKSRVTIEIHTDTGGEEKGRGDDSKAVVMEGLLRGKSLAVHEKNQVLHDEEFVIMRIFRRKKKGGGLLFGVFGGKEEEEDEEEGTVATRIC